MRNGDENADDIAGRFTGTYTGADARSCKYGTTCEITDKKGKGLPESGKGEALEIPHSPEKEPVSCLTDWHYPSGAVFFTQSNFPINRQHLPASYLRRSITPTHSDIVLYRSQVNVTVKALCEGYSGVKELSRRVYTPDVVSKTN